MEWDIFIAHAGPDTEIAEKLYERLDEHAKVFLDSKNLRLGDRWDEKLQEAQRAALISVILISESTDNAYYLKEEIGAAVDLARRDETRHRVVPIYLTREAAESENIPYGLRRLHSLFLENARDIPEAAEKLLELLNTIEIPGSDLNNHSTPPVNPLTKIRVPAGLPDWFQWWQPVAAAIILLALIMAFGKDGTGDPQSPPVAHATATEENAVVPPSDTPEPSETPTPSETPSPSATLEVTVTSTFTPTPSPTATARAGEDFARGCISNAQWLAVIGGSNPTTCLDLTAIGFTSQDNYLLFRRVTGSSAPRSINGIYTSEDLSSESIISFTLDLASITTSGNLDTILMLGFLPSDSPQNLELLDGSFVYVFKGGSTSSIKIALKEPGTALTSYKQWSKIQSANFPPGSYGFEMQIRNNSQGVPEMMLTVNGRFGSATDVIKLDARTAFNPAFFIGYLMEGGSSIDIKISDLCIRLPNQTITKACPWVEE